MIQTIKEARENRGLTQQELAKIMGKSTYTIIKWEAGVTEPKYSEFKELCVALKVMPDELIMPKKQV